MEQKIWKAQSCKGGGRYYFDDKNVSIMLFLSIWNDEEWLRMFVSAVLAPQNTMNTFFKSCYTISPSLISKNSPSFFLQPHFLSVFFSFFSLSS